MDLVVVLALSVIFVFGVVRPFVAEPFLIPSGSMSPTLEPGDRVLAAKSAYRLTEPGRGDLAVFEDGGGAVIKRVVGLPGDEISVEDGVLVVNGEFVREPYVDYGLTDSSFFGPETVPEGHVFVMGDNRSNSLDSRTTGPVPEEDLLGRAVLRFWPVERAGAL
ncbi:signal peptidase I [Rubrobacter marinus]|uniref:Signal peptidase I n=1 Tax=Rubrobacter marinus TaxID=2653852 RepID=A0A6G8PYP7_9ACTN|nr:signal peptidase I [Rubrobacter marinus]QIN79374.1 signal peptidase I [Rubrobacter marinus]